jgi:molybdopterin-guanine dinucleotide biosynthesis protein A
MYDRAMEAHSSDVAAFILAGGKSSRMGTDKAFVVLNGQTLLERALELARSVTSNVYIVGSPEKFAAFAPVVEDAFPECGPLAGIHAALRASSAQVNLILAVDVPFASAELLRYLLARARESAAVAFVPKAGGWQPLCAVYRREFSEVAEPALRDGRYKITTLFDSVETETIDQQELEAAGFSGEMFRNLNTPADLEWARETDHGA